MSQIMEENFNKMRSFIEKNKFVFEESNEKGTKRIDVQRGKKKCVVKVYNTGTIQIQGAESKLRTSLENVKKAIDNEEDISDVLPFEIENFPQVIKESIPEVDPIILKFIEEAILTVKAGSNLGCAFLLGGASEKAIYLLIDSFRNAIKDETRKQKFITKTSNKFISKVFNEFKSSWKSSLNKPDGFDWSHDIEIKIEQIFQFCRICRNEAGHPQLPPNLDKGVLLANMGQFVKYIEDLYKMMNYYNSHEVQF